MAAVTGCKGGTDATATERLWISGVPTSPKAQLTAFLTTRTADGQYIGAFFRGSLYRGGHDVFQWKSSKKETAKIKFLQDGKEASLRFESCTPTRGFDHCMIMHGDPTGTRKYQSRKRWTTRRKPKAGELPSAFFGQTIADLAEDDEDLAMLVQP